MGCPEVSDFFFICDYVLSLLSRVPDFPPFNPLSIFSPHSCCFFISLYREVWFAVSHSSSFKSIFSESWSSFIHSEGWGVCRLGVLVEFLFDIFLSWFPIHKQRSGARFLLVLRAFLGQGFFSIWHAFVLVSTSGIDMPPFS